MANLFWVGGSAAYDGVTNRLATTSGGSATVAAIASGDTVTFDANSPAAAVVATSAAISCTTLTLASGFTGSLTMSNALSVSGLMTVTQGTFNGNGQTLTLGRFDSSGALTRAVNITNCTINGLTIIQPWTIVATGLTLTTTGSTINCGIVSGTFTGAAFTYNIVNFTAATALVAIGISSTFAQLNLTAPGKVGNYRLNGNITVTGTLTIGGASTQGANRVLINGSSTPGNQAIFNCSGAAIVINGDVDFMDIGVSGSPSWTNSGNSYIGDCGGNDSFIVSRRTTPATQTWSGTSGGNWSANIWTSRVPLPQDDVVVSSAFSASQTITVDMPRMGANVSFAGTTGAPQLSRGSGITPNIFGSLTLVAGMSAINFTPFILAGRGTHTLTNAGQTFTNSSSITFQGPGSTYSMQDAFFSNGGFVVNDGTFTTNNQAITALTFSAASARATTLNLGTSTITLTSTAATATVWNTAATTTTMNAPLATVVLANAGTGLRTIQQVSAQVLGTFTYTVANSPGTLNINPGSGLAMTINNLNIGSGRSVQITNGRSLVITNWNVNGVNNGYLYLPGLTPYYVSTPDIVNFTGDIECVVSVSSWDGLSNLALIGQYTGTASTSSFLVWLDQATSKIRFYHSDGTTIRNTGTNGPVIAITGATRTYLKTTWRQSDARVQFFTSPDGTNWTQAGGDVTLTGTAGIARANVSTEIEIGAYDASGNPGTGGLSAIKLYNAQILNGIAGTPVLDADFTTHNAGSSNWLDTAKTQFTESSSNAATVTINGSLAQVGDGRVAITSSTPGSAATLSKSSGIVSSSYLSIQDSTATGGASWHALSSINVSNNSGWIFSTPPNPNGNFTLFGGPN